MSTSSSHRIVVKYAFKPKHQEGITKNQWYPIQNWPTSIKFSESIRFHRQWEVTVTQNYQVKNRGFHHTPWAHISLFNPILCKQVWFQISTSVQTMQVSLCSPNHLWQFHFQMLPVWHTSHLSKTTSPISHFVFLQKLLMNFVVIYSILSYPKLN